MCEFAIKPIWIGSAICTIGLCIATPAKAQITLRLSMNPSSVSFPDANPSTTPLSVRWDGQGQPQSSKRAPDRQLVRQRSGGG